MDITVTITQEQHDCVLAGLRKKNTGTDKDPVLVDDLTVNEWLQNAINGKANSCKKRAYMAAFKQK